MEEYARIAFSDLRKAFDQNGRLKPPSEWDDDTAAAMAGVDTVEHREKVPGKKDEFEYYQTKKVKLFDKLGALDALARRARIFPDIPQDNGEPEEKGPVTINFFAMERGELERFIHNYLSETRSRNRAKPGGKG